MAVETIRRGLHCERGKSARFAGGKINAEGVCYPPRTLSSVAVFPTPLLFVIQRASTSRFSRFVGSSVLLIKAGGFSTKKRVSIKLISNPKRTRFAPFDFKRFGILVFLGSLPVSLVAQEPVPPSRTQPPVTAFMAFRQELNAQIMSPEQRIKAMDEWRKINGSPFAGRRSEGDSSASVAGTAGLIARQKQAALSVSRTDEERELVELQWDVIGAVREMRASPTSPENRIRMFDEFSQANREAFQRIDTLRKTIAVQRMGNAPPHVPIPLPARSAEEAILRERRSIILQEIATRRNASNQLPPEERIAAMDRDRAYFKERADSLRELGKQLRARGQTNETSPNPR